MKEKIEFSELNWVYQIPKALSIATILIGIFLISIWIFVEPRIDSSTSHFFNTTPNEAFCFILLGISLWLNTNIFRTNYQKTISEISSGIVFVLASLTLMQYFFEIDYGIDQGAFRTYVIDYIFPPGRMSPLAAVNLCIVSFSLYFYENHFINFRITQSLMGLVLISSFLFLLTHIYQIHNLTAIFGIDRYSQSNIISIIVFLLLSAGFYFAIHTKNLAFLVTSNENAAVLVRRLIPPAIVLPVLLGYLGTLGVGERYYGAILGIALLVTCTILFFVGLILFNARLMNENDKRRRIIELELIRNQNLFQAFLDNTSSMIYICDIKGNYLLVNKEFEKRYQQNRGAFIGKNVSAIFPSEIANRIKKNMFEALKTEKPVESEETITNHNQTKIYLTNKFRLSDENGAPYAIGVISTDITEIKHIQNIYRESQERLNLALGAGNAGVWAWNIKENKVVSDEHVYSLFGIKSDEEFWDCEAVMNLIYYPDRNDVKQAIHDSLYNGKDFEIEFRILLSDENLKYIRARGSVERSPRGEATRLIGICWDTTSNKKSELELKQAKEAAESLAKRAEHANKAKSIFLASMSHEIRTPLNGIIGMTSILLDTPLTPKQREYTESVRFSSEALLAIINDILDFSKIESEKLELENIIFNLHTLIEDTIDTFIPQIRKKGIAIGANIDPDIPPCWLGDPIRIRQVLSNLLNNAIKFTKKGEISVKVKLLNETAASSSKKTLLFEVIDTGIGISETVYQKLFKPFSQGDASTTRQFGGTGLGLVISKRLVELMGGTIDVESIVDVGSRFWFTIQLEESTNDSYREKNELARKLTNLRILCVDDNAINREIIQYRSESWGMRCDLAENAVEALDKLKKAKEVNDPYVLILIDDIMPDMTGLELIEEIRTNQIFDDTIIVLLSSVYSSLNLKLLQKYNIAATISKPLHSSKIYETFIELLVETIQSDQALESNTEVRSSQQFLILLAEDNSINRQVSLLLLEKLGYHADAVANGVEAVQAFASKHYDLILMDCQMPEMDGYTATQEIRKLELVNKHHIPIIAMTAHALKGDKEKCLQYGMDDYIAKPIDMNVLNELLKKWLKTTEQTVIRSHHESKSQVIDTERLLMIFGEDSDSLKEFLISFMNSTKTLLDQLELAIKKQDQKTMKHLIHQLKGSSANSGVMELHEFASIAYAKLSEENGNIQSNYEDMCRAFERLKAEIQQYTIKDF